MSSSDDDGRVSHLNNKKIIARCSITFRARLQDCKRVRFRTPLVDQVHYPAPTPAESPTVVPDGLQRLFFRSFECDDPSYDDVQSVILPSDAKPLTFLVYGNQMELQVKDQEVTLKLAKRVCNIQQLKERQNLVRRIRRLDEAIGQTLQQLTKLREAWRLRGNVPDSFEKQEYDKLQQIVSAYNLNFVRDCTTLHQIWVLDPETGTEYHSWTIPVEDDSICAIFLPDLRLAEEGRYIEARFWFGCASMPTALNMPAADVTVIPDCTAPYRPFNVPAVWCDETKCVVPQFDNPSVCVVDR